MFESIKSKDKKWNIFKRIGRSDISLLCKHWDWDMWDILEVSPCLSDQSGSDPVLRALFIMFNGVNTLLLIKIQSGPRTFLWEMQLPIYGLGHYQKCLYQHHYDPHYMILGTTLQRLFPIALILELFLTFLKKTFSFFYFPRRTQKERRNVITVTYCLENGWELLSNIYSN